MHAVGGSGGCGMAEGVCGGGGGASGTKPGYGTAAMRDIVVLYALLPLEVRRYSSGPWHPHVRACVMHCLQASHGVGMYNPSHSWLEHTVHMQHARLLMFMSWMQPLLLPHACVDGQYCRTSSSYMRL